MVKNGCLKMAKCIKCINYNKKRFFSIQEKVDHDFDLLRKKLGKIPTRREMAKEFSGSLKKISCGDYLSEIHRWNQYLEHRKLKINMKHESINKERVLKVFYDLKFEEKRIPPANKFKKEAGGIYDYILKGKFDPSVKSYREFLIKIGETPLREEWIFQKEKIDKLFEEERKKLGKIPTHREFAKKCRGAYEAIRNGRYSYKVRGWNDYLASKGIYPIQDSGHFVNNRFYKKTLKEALSRKIKGKNLKDYIIVPQEKVIISKKIMYKGLNFEESEKILSNNNLIMPTTNMVSFFMLNLLESYKYGLTLYNGKKEVIRKKEINSLLTKLKSFEENIKYWSWIKNPALSRENKNIIKMKNFEGYVTFNFDEEGIPLLKSKYNSHKFGKNIYFFNFKEGYASWVYLNLEWSSLNYFLNQKYKNPKLGVLATKRI